MEKNDRKDEALSGRQSPLPGVGARRINYPAGTRKNTKKSLANLDQAVKTVLHESRDGWAVLIIGAQDGRKLFQVVAVHGELVAKIGHGSLVLDHERIS